MSATGEDQDYADALLVTCGLGGCEQPPGKACVNSVDGVGPRDEPHQNRVVRGRRALSAQHTAWPHRGGNLTGDLGAAEMAMSTSARLRRVEQERDQAREMWATARQSHELTVAELASARAELTLRGGWSVARDGGRDCEGCDQEIARGQAYKQDTTGDLHHHIHCPTNEGVPPA